jgi:cell division protein FtsW
MVSRADRSAFAEWWWTVDKPLLTGLIVLLVGGVVLSLGGSPAVAERLGYDSFHFVTRHLIFFLPTVVLLIAVSFLSPRMVRRLSLILFVGMIGLMLLTFVAGVEVNGSRRWIDVAGFSLQPSEFLKPAFIVICAWVFTEHARNGEIPGNIIALLLLVVVVTLLILQPDFGQTILVAVSWGALFFLAGMPWSWIAVIAGMATVGVFAAYTTIPHVAGRIDQFLNPAAGDTYQIDTALQAFVNGGWLGVGPGEGTVKRVLPDAHTDFIFAVAAEEFGVIVCLALVAIFAFVVIRGLTRSLRLPDPFTRVAAAGLVILFGVQSVINMAVNLNLMPSKGMTLPFISYGGSSMLAVAIGMGLVLALTRQSPGVVRPRRPLSTASVPDAV